LDRSLQHGIAEMTSKGKSKLCGADVRRHISGNDFVQAFVKCWNVLHPILK
jgi:hypothetical protein